MITSHIFPGQSCISSVTVSGPSVVDITQISEPWVDLSCSFLHSRQEYKELDIKWYFSTEEEPFLQWVPSNANRPQIIGQRFRNRLTVSHKSRNISSSDFQIEQKLRVGRPSVHLSGVYTCKVATFFSEQNSSHNLLLFGKLQRIITFMF